MLYKIDTLIFAPIICATLHVLRPHYMFYCLCLSNM